MSDYTTLNNNNDVSQNESHVHVETETNNNGNGNNGYDSNLFANLTIGVIFSEVKREYFPTEEQYITEKDASHDADLIAAQIAKLGAHVVKYPGDEYLAEALRRDKPDMVFNLVDSVKGNESLSSTIPGILEMLDIKYTGADMLGLSLTYNKFLLKKLLAQVGVPIPNFQLFTSANDPIDPQLRFPLISKLNEIHGGVEITQDAVSENEKHLRERLKYLITTYKQPVLVEEFIVGREVVAYLIEGLNTKVYLAERMFNKPNEKYIFTTFDDQWGTFSNDKSTWPYTYDKYEDTVLKELTRKAFEVTKMSDYGKFDVRVDQSGRYFFIDSNANPAFGPKDLSTAMGLVIQELYGVPFSFILKRLIISTISKKKL